MQTVIACYCSSYSVFLLVFLAATVGAFAAHGIQALTHEMCHSVGKNGGSIKVFGVGVGNVCTRLACATTNFPWSMYYEQYHTKHHAYTGSRLDADGIILFRWWHEPPIDVFRTTKWGKVRTFVVTAATNCQSDRRSAADLRHSSFVMVRVAARSRLL